MLKKLYKIQTPYSNPRLLIGKNGGEIFHEMMIRHNVKHIFGYPGGAILPVFDAIYKSKNFKLILPRHEQGAGHMAEGYARSTGKTGVVLVTSGPGATNVITPMQDALSDGIPLVVFTGQIPTSNIGTDAFQEADIIGISRSCTKWNTMVKNVKDLPQRINEAFLIANSGRPGPVLVDLPKDVTASILYECPNLEPILKFKHIESEKNNTESIKEVARLIKIAKSPVLYVGNGIINTPNGNKLLKKLVEKTNIPVTTTLQGLGAFDELNPLSLHMLGMHGSFYANLAMQNADLIISLGARFDDRVTCNLSKFAPSARLAEKEGRGGIVQFDISPKNINKTVPVTIGIEGKLSENLTKLNSIVSYKEHKDWIKTIQEWKHKYPFVYQKSITKKSLKPQEVIEELNKQLSHELKKNNVIITTGVGCHQMWAAQYIRWQHPRSFISSGGLGTMGFGLPSAIGAQIGKPNHYVIDIDGDASFSMTGMELMTASEYNIPVKIIILNNSFQGMVKQWQDLFYKKRYSGTKMTNPDFVKLAESMKCPGLRVEQKSDLPEKIRQFLFDRTLDCNKTRPVLLECIVDADEHVYPMVPSGKGLHEMILK